VAGVAVGVALLAGSAGSSAPFLVVWLAGWAAAWAFTGGVWVWHAFGREVVEANSDNLTISVMVGGWTISRRHFEPSLISNLRAKGWFGNFYSFRQSFVWWGITGGTIAFEYQGRTHRLGIQLEEWEADNVVANLRPFVPGTSGQVEGTSLQ
jgi:hypothetical protein